MIDETNCKIQIIGEDLRMNIDHGINDLFALIEHNDDQTTTNPNVMGTDCMSDFHELYLDSLQYSSNYFNHYHHQHKTTKFIT